MGYTGLHYAVKDAYSLSGVIITISFFTLVAVLLIPLTIIVLIVWVSMRLVQRHKAKQREQLTTSSPPIAVGFAVTALDHGVEDAEPYRFSRFDRGPVRVDYFCYDCACGETIAAATPGQAAVELRDHLHDGIDWAAMDLQREAHQASPHR